MLLFQTITLIAEDEVGSIEAGMDDLGLGYVETRPHVGNDVGNRGLRRGHGGFLLRNPERSAVAAKSAFSPASLGCTNASHKEVPMQTIALSEAALALLKLHLERKGDIPVDDMTRETYRELARAGLMVVGHSFTRGREAFYKLTDAGWDFACAQKST